MMCLRASRRPVTALTVDQLGKPSTLSAQKARSSTTSEHKLATYDVVEAHATKWMNLNLTNFRVAGKGSSKMFQS